MMHTEDEIIVAGEITAGGVTFRLEEYWEEDDSGYCVSDYILARHTRLRAFSLDGALLREFALDSREYDKDMWTEDGAIAVRWQPEYNEVRVTRIRIADLEVISEESRETAPVFHAAEV